MSLYGSLYTGISGLNSNGSALSVISDNIANMNTIGFKRSRAVFQDIMTYPTLGIGSENYIGVGSTLSGVEQEMSQGSLLNTGNGMDLAIQGAGFFVVGGQQAGQSGNFYTRAGQFHVDNNGYMVNTAGFRLQGYLADSAGNISSALTDLQFTNASAPVLATSEVEMTMNLNAGEDTPMTFDPTDPDATSHFSTATTVYDSLGAAHDVTLYFTKTADNTWSWNAMQEGAAVASASGELTFNSDGQLLTATTTASSFDFPGATPGQVVDFNFGDPISTGGTGLAGTTQFASSSSVSAQSQDGYGAGDLNTILIDDEGVITGTFTNGERRVMGQIALANFKGAGLDRMGNNLWQETTASGQPLIGAASTGSRGSINSSLLEQSNVDLAAEFVDMIVAQRGYQANGRTITTSDQLLQEVLNLKR